MTAKVYLNPTRLVSVVTNGSEQATLDRLGTQNGYVELQVLTGLPPRETREFWHQLADDFSLLLDIAVQDRALVEIRLTAAYEQIRILQAKLGNIQVVPAAPTAPVPIPAPAMPAATS